jgi:hypothetical protein
MTVLAVGLPELTTYLQGAGWRRTVAGRVAEIWTYNGHEVVVPKIESAPDFQTRVEILTKDLQRLEDRPASAIRDEISRQFVDVTDVSADHSFGDAAIPLEAGEKLFGSAKRLVVAAAAATLRRRGYFGREVPQRARDQARSAMAGHTRPGSYVVPIISQARLPELPWQGDQPHLVKEVEEAAFDRRVTVTLARSLGVLQQLTVDRDTVPTGRDINDGVGEGLSYELCDSVIRVLKDPYVDQFEVEFRWAPAAPSPRGVTGSVGFPGESMPVLEHVASGLRRDVENRQQVVYGVVVTLSSREGQEGGRVDIDALVEGKKRSIRLELGPRDYDVAVSCHKRTPVQVRGVLHLQPGRQATMDVEAFEPDLALPAVTPA